MKIQLIKQTEVSGKVWFILDIDGEREDFMESEWQSALTKFELLKSGAKKIEEVLMSYDTEKDGEK